MSMNYDDDWNDDDREFRNEGKGGRKCCNWKVILISVIVGAGLIVGAVFLILHFQDEEAKKPIKDPKTVIEMDLELFEDDKGCAEYYCKANKFSLIRVIGKDFPINDYGSDMEILINNKKEKKVECLKDFKKQKAGTLKIQISFKDEELKDDDLRLLLQGLTFVTGITFTKIKTDNMKSMEGFFKGCVLLTSLNLTDFNTEKVENMANMFDGCKSLETLDLSSFETSNVQKMGSMFKGCTALRNMNVDHFDTAKVTSFSYMFFECQNFVSLNMEFWSFDQTKAFDFMFFDDIRLTAEVKAHDIERLEALYENIFADIKVNPLP